MKKPKLPREYTLSYWQKEIPRNTQKGLWEYIERPIFLYKIIKRPNQNRKYFRKTNNRNISIDLVTNLRLEVANILLTD